MWFAEGFKTIFRLFILILYKVGNSFQILLIVSEELGGIIVLSVSNSLPCSLWFRLFFSLFRSTRNQSCNHQLVKYTFCNIHHSSVGKSEIVKIYQILFGVVKKEQSYPISKELGRVTVLSFSNWLPCSLSFRLFLLLFRSTGNQSCTHQYNYIHH